jgi:hypothetical protein
MNHYAIALIGYILGAFSMAFLIALIQAIPEEREQRELKTIEQYLMEEKCRNQTK